MKRLWIFLLLMGLLTLLLAVARPQLIAVWPSLVALIGVFVLRNVLLGLFLGALAGAVLLAGGALWGVPLQLVEQHLLPHFASPWKSGAILFTLILGGFVALLEQGKVFNRLFARLLQRGGGRRMESCAAGFGLICFFDGLANSLMVGRIFQPLAERAGVSKLRLAYIVDTTSAAVACLAFISTWIAFQLSMIREGFSLAGREQTQDVYRWFFLSWPYNFYCLISLLLLGLVIRFQLNWGPMRGAVAATPAAARDGNAITARDDSGYGLWRALLPLAALLVFIFVATYQDGTQRRDVPLLPFAWEKLALAFSHANVPAILVAGSALAALLAAACFPRRTQSPPLAQVFGSGVIRMFQPVCILVFAWMLSSTLKDLGTAAFIASILQGRLPVESLPALVFLTGAVVSFSTGTSWGTMGILMPLAIPLVFALAPSESAALVLVPPLIGAVFSGAVFGDHCSPLSDTTLVSSIACGVEPLDHVRTQLPYAVFAGACALAGFACAGFWPSAWVFPVILFASVLAFLALYRISGKKLHEQLPQNQ